MPINNYFPSPEIMVGIPNAGPAQNLPSSVCNNAHVDSPGSILLSTAKVTVAVGQSSTKKVICL